MNGGEDTFVNLRHFIGVVEDRKDPLKIGRVRVRVFSIHTDNKNFIPTDDLPWAMVVAPITHASTSGVGRSPTGIVEGAWVYGVFLDEKEYQQPLVIGTINGIPTEAADPSIGFHDPNAHYPTTDPDVSDLDEPSVTRLARDEDAEKHIHLINKRKNKDDLGTIKSAAATRIPTVLADKDDKFYGRLEWVEPHPRFGGQDKEYPEGVTQSTWPLNHVWHSESGHVLEVDDTPDGERIQIYHTKGSFVEMQPDGCVVTKMANTNYTIMMSDNNVYIKGNVSLTVDGDVRSVVHGNKIEEVDKDYHLTVRGDMRTHIGGSEGKVVITDQSTQINGNQALRISKNRDFILVGNLTEDITGNRTKTIAGNETISSLKNVTQTVGEKTVWISTKRLDMVSATSMNIGSVEDLSMKSQANVNVESIIDYNLLVHGNSYMTASNSEAGLFAITAKTADVDFDLGHIVVTSGSITDTTVTLHSHTHLQTGGTAPDGDGPDDKQTASPTSGT